MLLLVDPDQDTLRVMSRILKRKEISTRTAADAPTAMECLRRKLPEIVLIDVDMPGGPELLRQVRTHPKGREITIVLHTSSPYDDRRAADMGADATLLKGMYDLPMLVQRLRAYELLRGSAA